MHCGQPPNAVLRVLGMREGMSVVDLCCGDGLFTTPLAKLVGHGEVVAVDLDNDLLEAAQVDAANAQQQNIKFVEVDAMDRLPSNGIVA